MATSGVGQCSKKGRMHKCIENTEQRQEAELGSSRAAGHNQAGLLPACGQSRGCGTPSSEPPPGCYAASLGHTLERLLAQQPPGWQPRSSRFQAFWNAPCPREAADINNTWKHVGLSVDTICMACTTGPISVNSLCLNCQAF